MEASLKKNNEIWNTLQVKDDNISQQIKEATFDVTFYLSLVFGLFYSGLYYYLEAYKTAIIEFSLLCFFMPLIFIFRKKRIHYVAGNLFIFLYVAILTTCASLTGGMYSPSTLWLLIPPFIASVLLGSREIIFWGLVAIIDILIIGYLTKLNLLPSSEITKYVEEFYIFSFVALILFLLGFMLVTNYMRLKIILSAQEYQKEAQRNEYLATFAQVTAGLAHEINNPLTVALGHSRKLLKIVETQSRENIDVINCSKKITKSIDRISKIILSMKNLSRDGSNDEKHIVSIKELIEDASNVFVNSFEEGNVKFTVDYNSLENFQLYSHRIQLGQVLFNLIKNSLDEVIKTSNRWIKIELNKVDRFFFIKVIDSGQGINQEIIEKVFSPFYSTKVVGEGTGLGLSLSLSMMKKNGGDLYLDKESKKTCFVMKIPFK